MEIREINASATLALRKRLLRPHLSAEECIYPGDDDRTSCHLGAFIDNALIGIVSIYRKGLPDQEDNCAYQFRALAIVEASRNKGYGLTLLHAVEKYARDKRADYLWANARITAINFYRKANYSIDDNEFIVEGVGPHVIVSRHFQ
ncbi:MAG: GNAT superfamily N-acetyltransferase [Pseudohongiellaceae bacterium]